MDNLKLEHRTFSSLFMDQLNTHDVKGVLESQQQIISRLDYTNKNLTKSNKASLETYNSFGVKDYQSYVQLLNSMKQDLEFIFKRIKLIKTKLELKHPVEYRDAIKKVQKNKKFANSDDEDEDPINEEDDTFNSPSNSGRASSFLKERSMSSASASSSTSSASALVVNLLQTAKNRINTSGYKEMVNGFFNTTTVNTQTSEEVPVPVLSTFLTNKLTASTTQVSENLKTSEIENLEENNQEIDNVVEPEIENLEINSENTQEIDDI